MCRGQRIETSVQHFEPVCEDLGIIEILLAGMQKWFFVSKSIGVICTRKTALMATSSIARRKKIQEYR